MAGALAALGSIPLPVVLTFAALWYGAEVLLARTLGWPLSLRSPLLWVARDLMLPVLFVAAMCGRGFDWRGNEMDVRAVRRRDGGLQLVEE